MKTKKISLNMSDLFEALETQNKGHSYVNLPDDKPKTTSFRIESDLRQFCDEKAAHLGVSYQSFIGMVLRAVMLESTGKRKVQCQLMVERFFYLFEMNAISTASIPKVLKDFNFRQSDLVSHDSVLDRLSPAVLTYLSQQYDVPLVWLQGLGDHDFMPSCKAQQLLS